MAHKNKTVKVVNKSISDNTAMVLFLLVLVSLLFFLDSMGTLKRQNAEPPLLGMITLSSPADSGPGFLVGDQIDKVRLQEFARMDYPQLKQALGTDKDFSIALLDENGQPIPVNGKYCIGSPELSVAGYTCG